MICWKCGRQVPDGYAFCPGCGERLNAQGGAVQAAQTPTTPSASTPGLPTTPSPTVGGTARGPLLRWGKKGIFIAAAAAVCLVAVCVAIVVGVSGGKKQVSSFLYVTDEGELMYVENASGRAEPILVDEDVAYGVVYEMIKECPADYIFFMDNYDSCGTFGLTPDGRRIYYIGNNETLYTITVDALKRGESPERIARDIDMNSQYSMRILDNGDAVYFRDIDGEKKQYLYDGTESRIFHGDSSSVDGYDYYTVYTNEDYTEFSYYRTASDGGGEAECIAEKIWNMYAREGNTVLYASMDFDKDTNNLTVYSCVPGQQPVVLADGVSGVYGASLDNGRATFYYTVETDAMAWSFYDCFSDEFFSQDAVNPEDAAQRDYLRSEISENQFGVKVGTLCYFDGREARTVAEDVCLEPTDAESGYGTELGHTFAPAIDGRFILRRSSAFMYTYDYEDVMLYRKINRALEPVCDLDDLADGRVMEYFEDEEDLRTYAAGYFITEQWYQSVDGAEYALDMGGYEPQLDSDGIYYFEWWPCLLNERELVLMGKQDDEYVLLDYKSGKNGFEPDGVIFESYDPFYYGAVETDGEKDVLYIVSDRYTDDNYDTWSDWSIYSDGKLRTVAREVIPLSIFSDRGDNEYMITYLTYENEEYRGSTCFDIAVTNGGKSVAVFEDVTLFKVLNDSTVLYISDGDLYLWNGRETSRVARGVCRVMLCNN